MTLLELADACERAKGADKALNREIALAAGWHRYTPSELSRSNPGWIAPEDFAGETVGKDGRKRPILDSLHGTDIWREPRDFTGSLDAAMTLVPGGLHPGVSQNIWHLHWHAWMGRQGRDGSPDDVANANAATPALAICAAALRARHAMESE